MGHQPYPRFHPGSQATFNVTHDDSLARLRRRPDGFPLVKWPFWPPDMAILAAAINRSHDPEHCSQFCLQDAYTDTDQCGTCAAGASTVCLSHPQAPGCPSRFIPGTTSPTETQGPPPPPKKKTGPRGIAQRFTKTSIKKTNTNSVASHCFTIGYQGPTPPGPAVTIQFHLEQPLLMPASVFLHCCCLVRTFSFSYENQHSIACVEGPAPILTQKRSVGKNTHTHTPTQKPLCVHERRTQAASEPR